MPRRAETRLRRRRRWARYHQANPAAGRAASDATGRAVVRNRPRPRATRSRISAIAAVMARYRGVRRRSVLDRRRRFVSSPTEQGPFTLCRVPEIAALSGLNRVNNPLIATELEVLRGYVIDDRPEHPAGVPEGRKCRPALAARTGRHRRQGVAGAGRDLSL